MADFLSNLWESVFTAGPTPTLLIATNATFAALQLILLLLLVATYSIHFVILSAICGGLWYSINWFAAEVAAVKAEEDAKKAREEREKGGKVAEGQSEDKGGESADDEGESTEVEELGGAGGKGMEGSLSLSGFEEGVVGKGKEGAAVRQRNVKAQKGGAATGKPSGDLSGEISTDSEWEKVEDGR